MRMLFGLLAQNAKTASSAGDHSILPAKEAGQGLQVGSSSPVRSRRYCFGETPYRFLNCLEK